ncbi:hypothetical protein [Streptococcus sanguinis]|uniref:hypothetical protein n=1 Tax=Streptococcus sanguinis TaxID=1305 RepID=UPI000FBAAC6E|nr:hypothetical protein [Streptococcus sanguinis]RSI22087.1 hypothetical protein D8883_09990 [Streptococcus sanguinis]
MVKVNYASLQTQSSTMSSASQSRVAGFNQLISAFDSFGGSGGELIGTGYDAARAYATSVMSPYYKGCILYSEAVADAANTLADSYAAKCGAENLDEEQLQAEIDSATRGCMSLSASISGLQSKAKPAAGDAERISSLQNQLTAAENQLTAAQKKLDNLRAFSAESPSACTSADGYQGLVSKAMSGISVSFGGGGFALPEDLTWVSDVEQGWADREIAMENNYLSALDKVYNGESLTEAELTAIERYAAAYPDRVDSSVLEYVQKARQVKAEEMRIRVLIDKVDEGKVLTTEETNTLQDYQSNHPEGEFSKTVQNALLSNDKNIKRNLNSLSNHRFPKIGGATKSQDDKLEWSEIKDALFGDKNSFSKEIDYDLIRGGWFSTYTKEKGEVTTKNSGVFNLKTNNLHISGVGIDLGFYSLDMEFDNWHFNAEQEISVFGYSAGTKLDAGFSTYTGIEADFAGGIGRPGKDGLSHSDFIGLKLSSDFVDGILGGYHQHIDSVTKGDTEAIRQTENGVQIGNGGEIIGVGLIAVALLSGPEAWPSIPFIISRMATA